MATKSGFKRLLVNRFRVGVFPMIAIREIKQMTFGNREKDYAGGGKHQLDRRSHIEHLVLFTL